MLVKDLIVELSKCDPERLVRMLTEDGDSLLLEVRECKPNGRSRFPYTELSSNVSEEYLGEPLEKNDAKNNREASTKEASREVQRTSREDEDG